MSNETVEETGATSNEGTTEENPSAEGSQEKVFSQEEVNRLLADEKRKARAKAAKEAEELKAENQRQKEELEGFKQEKQVNDWKKSIAAETGVPADVLRGTTEEDIRAHAEALAPHFKEHSAPVVDGEGKQPPVSGEDSDWLRTAFNKI